MVMHEARIWEVLGSNPMADQNWLKFLVVSSVLKVAKELVIFKGKSRPQWSHGYHTCHWSQDLQVQTWPGSIDYVRV